MKKLMVLALMMFAVSCSNPEDKATGNPDSASFNQSGNDKNLNTPADEVGNQSHANNNDTSSSPSVSKQNAKSATEGTNRSYVPGGGKDSAKKK